MERFVKTIDGGGNPTFINIDSVRTIGVDNGGPTNWAVYADLDDSTRVNLIQAISSDTAAYSLQRQVAEALGMIDPTEFEDA